MDLPIGSEGYFRMSFKEATVERRRMIAALLKAHRLFRAAQSRPAGVGHRELILHSVGEAVLWMRAGATQQPQPLDERVTRAVEFMNKNLDAPLDLEQLCDAALASRSQLSLLFVRELGVSPMHYLEQIRMERAKQMLRLTPYPIKHIAGAVGFEDPRYFVKRFRLSAGTTPRRFRNHG
jgi:transcriptional regulator GlxA family with amidase domain